MALKRRGTTWTTGALVMVLSLTASAQNQVHIVDQASGPGTDFVEIKDAVLAAASGDVILVRPGSYLGVTIDGKSVSIVADTGSAVVRPAVKNLVVRNLGLAQRVVLRGLYCHVIPNPFGVSVNLAADANAGDLLVEDCHFEGGSPVVQVSDSKNVLLTRCLVTGGGRAVDSTNSSIHVYQGTLQGGKGNDTFVTPFGVMQAGTGWAALELEGGHAVIAGAHLLGGDGGNGIPDGSGSCYPGGDGGPGLLQTGVSPVSTILDSTLTGGAGGTVPPPCGNNGVAGAPTAILAGTTTTLPESIRTLVVESPVREGQTSQLVLTGLVGEPTLLLFSMQASLQYSPALSGTLVPGVPLFGVPFIAIPPGGSVSAAIPIPAGVLAAGVEGLEIFVQIAVPGAMGYGVVGSSSVLAVIDGAL